MKSALLIAAGILSAASQASAAITIITPWADTTWSAGGAGNITWTATGTDATANCDIQLLDGTFTNANMVAQITASGSPVACSAGSYVITPLNDFASGSYWIRIGQSSAANWYYSGVFKFAGNGTAAPLSLASSAAVATTATALSTAAGASVTAASSPAVTTGLVAGKNAASASASASATTSGSSTLTMSKVAVAAGAIAAIAFSL